MTPLRVFIGYDGREPAGYEVTLRSLLAHAADPGAIEVRPLLAAHLRGQGLYSRPEEFRGGIRHDVISNAPMSTEFALTRFLVPALCDFEGWAVFCDCDFLFRADIAELFALRDESKAVQVVQHNYLPLGDTKMDNQPQAAYPRKNWSSLILWNCGHPAHAALDLDSINGERGLKLHAFWWLPDILIGQLPEAWNWLVGVSPTTDARGARQEALGTNPLEPRAASLAPAAPCAAHFTTGTPDMPGHEHDEFADEWRAFLPVTRHPSPVTGS